MIYKDTITFKKLRDDGVNKLGLKDNEIIQVITKKGVLCIIDQEYYLKLLSMEVAINEHVYGIEQKVVTIDFDKKCEEITQKFEKMMELTPAEKKIKQFKESFSKEINKLELMLKKE